MADKGINFKIDAEIYKRVKIRIVEKDTTLKGYVLSLIMKDLSSNTGKDKM